MLSNRISVLLLLTLTLTACVHHAPLDEDLVVQVKAARSEGDLKRALDLTGRASSEHPQFEDMQTLRAQVLKDIEKYQRERIREANALASSGRWQEAFALLANLDREWRRSELVEAARTELSARQNVRLQQLRADLLVAEARWLHSQQSQVEQLGTLEDNSARQLNQQLQQRRTQLVSELQQLSQHFAAAGDWQRTRDLLEGARQLSKQRERDPLLVEAEKRLATVVHRQERAATQRARQQGESLLERYRNSESIGDLVAARDFLQRHNRDGNLDDIGSRLESLSRDRLRQGLKLGDSRYATGDYAGAQRAWKEVVPLYPDDPELKGRLERVERVLNNLQRLAP